jgi:chaperonin GroEL
MEGRNAVITVGGFTEVEIAENRDKIVDCLNSCKTALDEGIIPGGGACFIHALSSLENMKFDNIDMNVGVNIFRTSIIVFLHFLKIRIL